MPVRDNGQPQWEGSLNGELEANIQKLIAAEVARVRSEFIQEFADFQEKLNALHKQQNEQMQAGLAEVRHWVERAALGHLVSTGSTDEKNDAQLSNGKICVEVGNEKFFTTAEVLRGEGHPDPSTRDSYFTVLLSGRWRPSLFIARSPESFRFVLQYLTYHAVPKYPTDASTLLMLTKDADFFGLKELHERLSMSINTWTGIGNTGGRWQWGNRLETPHGALVTNDMGTEVIARFPGLHLVAVRDQQKKNDNERKLELRSRCSLQAKSFMFTADGPVCTHIVQLMNLAVGDTVTVCSDEPVLEDLCSSLSIIRLDDRFEHGAWRGVAYVDAWQWTVADVGACSRTYRLEPNTQEITICQSGRYIIAARDVQNPWGRKMMSVQVNNSVVASSYVNTGHEDTRTRATVFLMQLVELSSGDRLRVVSDSPQANREQAKNSFEPASLLLVRLPSGMSCASWQATGHNGPLELWGRPRICHEDYFMVEADTKVRVARSGFYLVMVRAVHGRNNRKRLELLHNEAVAAVSHVTTDGTHTHCGHIVEVVQCLADDHLSVSCQDAVDEEVCSTLSLVLLRPL